MTPNIKPIFLTLIMGLSWPFSALTEEVDPCIKYRTADLKNRNTPPSHSSSNVADRENEDRATRVAGLGVDEVRSFLKCLKAQHRNKQVISKLIQYPLRSKIGPIRTEKIFLQRYDTLLDAKAIEAIETQEFSNLVIRSDGIGLASGKIWFSGFISKEGRELPIKIIAIN